MFKGWFQRTDSVAEHPWMQDITGLVKAFGQHPRRATNRLELTIGQATTEVWFRPADLVSSDGARVQGVFEVNTLFSSDTPRSLGTPEAAAMLNMTAALGAVVAERSMPCIKSRVTVYEGDDSSKRLYVPMLAYSAVSSARVLASTLARAMGLEGSTSRDPLHQAGPSLWTEADFSTARDFLSRAGALSMSSPTGLTAEFPWDPGVVSMVEGKGRTALLQLESGAEHPMLGAGLFAKLDIPISFPPEEAPRVADTLNRRELESVDAPPFFGAWCSRPNTGDVTFVSFLPNILHDSGNATNVAVWMGHRSAMAKEILEKNFTA